MLLALIMMLSILGTNVQATEEKEWEMHVMPKTTGNFSVDVEAGEIARGKSFSLEAGESVTINASYSPSFASVDFGVIAPDNLFYGINTKTGSINKTIKVNQRGTYTFAIRNNSAYVISVSGFVTY